jgi:SAM-dependent methyltransferase
VLVGEGREGLEVIPLDEWLLRKLSRTPGTGEDAAAAAEPAGDPLGLLKAEFADLGARVSGKRIADFGCGLGAQAMALASSYPCEVVGIDTNPRTLAEAVGLARQRSLDRGQLEFCDFTAPDLFGTFDLVISQNAMEHYPDPAAALDTMRKLLRPAGQIMLTFGPPWFAPWGSHMQYFCRVPWVNLLFRERTVMAVRARFRSDGALRYEDVESGLNKMTLAKLEGLLETSRLGVDYIRYHGVKGQDWVSAVPWLRELLVNQVTCLLTRRE